MLVVQKTFRQGYKKKLMILKTALSVKTSIVIINELFIDNREIFYSGFNFYLPQKKRKEIRVRTTIQKYLANKIIIDHRIDLINQP